MHIKRQALMLGGTVASTHVVTTSMAIRLQNHISGIELNGCALSYEFQLSRDISILQKVDSHANLQSLC